MTRNACVVALLFIFSVRAGAQTNGPASIPGDSIAFHISQALSKILAVANDPSKDPKLAMYEWPSETTVFDLRYVNIKDDVQVNTWSWRVFFEKDSKGLSQEEIGKKFKRISRIVDSLYPGKKEMYTGHGIDEWAEFKIGEAKISIYKTWNYSNSKGYYSLTVSFDRKGLLVKKITDSLFVVYTPKIISAKTSDELVQQSNLFAGDLEKNKIPKEKITKLFSPLVKSIANKNIEWAFDMLMGVNGIDYMALKDSLKPGQQTMIKEMAAKKTGKTVPSKPVIPVSCDSVKQALGNIPGTYKLGTAFSRTDNNIYKVCVIYDYDCKTNEYRLVERELVPASKSSTGKEDYNLVEIYSMDPGYNRKLIGEYLICSHCKGFGVTAKLIDPPLIGWEQVNSRTAVYAPFNEVFSPSVSKTECNACHGKGWKKKL